MARLGHLWARSPQRGTVPLERRLVLRVAIVWAEMLWRELRLRPVPMGQVEVQPSVAAVVVAVCLNFVECRH